MLESIAFLPWRLQKKFMSIFFISNPWKEIANNNKIEDRMNNKKEQIIQRRPICNDFGKGTRVCWLKHYNANQLRWITKTYNQTYL